MINFILAILLFLCVFYASFIIFLNRSWNRLSDINIHEDFIPESSLSIIIPVRNESTSIASCIQSILDNNYPKHLYEIIVIDDFSTDETSSIVSSFSNKQIKIISQLPENSGGKKEAISLGIAQARFDTIVQTDGDTEVPNNWLRGIAYHFEEGDFKLLTGPVIYVKNHNHLLKFQALELTGLMLLTGVGIHSHHFHLANGANMAYNKKVYLDNQNSNKSLASGDDVFLIQSMASKAPEAICFLKSPELAVLTQGEPTFSGFIQQRIRWATKTSSYNDWKMQVILAFIFLFCLAIPFSFLLGFFYHPLFIKVGISITLVKLVSDFSFLKKSSSYFNQAELLNGFLLSFLFHTVYMIVIGFIGMFVRNYTWKGRKVK